MPNRVLKVRFHKIKIGPNRTRPFSSALDALFGADRSSRVIHQNDYYHFFEPLAGEMTQGFALAKERKDNWPHWLRRIGEIDQIQITDDGFLSEVSFYWITANNRLLVELYNRRGPSPIVLSDYLLWWQQRNRPRVVSAEFQTILDRDAYERFLRMNLASSIRFKIEAAEPGIQLINDELGQDRLLSGLAALQETGALSIEVRLSMKRTRNSLGLGLIRDLVDRLRGNDVTQALDIAGSAPGDGRKEMLDLLGKKRLCYEFPVRTRTGYVDHITILEAIRTGYEAHRDYLNQRILNDE